jgi:zinc transporter ZupT
MTYTLHKLPEGFIITSNVTPHKGYNGFYSTIDFTKDGKFIQQGFWQ